MESPVITLDSLTKSYGKARGIENVSLKVEEGEIFGFIGPNGAGKSTTIRILMNLIFPTGGSAQILGMDIIRDTKKIKQKVGYIPSDASPYSFMNVEEFLSYCSRFYDSENSTSRIAELSSLFELDLTRRINELSVGNRKKVSIIQSFLHNPQVLIVDEPTTGLDPLMQARFFDLLQAENQKGMTIFFSSHVLSEVQMLCKRVAIIKDGAIIKIEDIDVLRKTQLKKIMIEFGSITDKEKFIITDIEQELDSTGNSRSVMYSGDINNLLKSLSSVNIVNLTIEEPSLEEIFMHYYI
jgi:ABC-2 type transport system ATP-binding protein